MQDCRVDELLAWRRLAPEDLPLLADWLREPPVLRWWNHEFTSEAVERDFGPSARGEESGEDFVVALGDTPIGLVQRSVISEHIGDLSELEALVDVPHRAVELDYLLGKPELRGCGMDTLMIEFAVARTWSETDAPAVIVPVVAANVASWRALERTRFLRIAEGPMEPDNPIGDPLHYIYRLDRPTGQPPHD